MDSKAFQELREASELCDLTVQIGDKLLHMHRIVVATRSQYFRGLLRSGMKDSNHVVLDEIAGGYETMELIVDFCYGIDIGESLDESNIAHVLCSARYLQMSGTGNLEEICTTELNRFIREGSPSTCLNILQNCSDIAIVAEREGVTDTCIEYAVNYLQTDIYCLGDFCGNMGNLPILWFVQILEKMKAKCSRLLITSMAAFYISVIMKLFGNCSHTQHVVETSNILSCPSQTDPENLLQAFEIVLSFIPDEAPTPENEEGARDPMWFARALDFSTTNTLAPSARLYAMCAAVYDKLSGVDEDCNACYNFQPAVFIELNRVVQVNRSGKADSVVTMTDAYLFNQARRRSITASVFALVFQSTDWCTRTSFDPAFSALEEMLKIPQDTMPMSASDIEEIILHLDFTKLSQESLERASRNERIPHYVTMTAAVKVCSQLRCRVEKMNEEVAAKSSCLLETESRLDKEQQKQEKLSADLDKARKDIKILGIEKKRLYSDLQQKRGEYLSSSVALNKAQRDINTVEREKQKIKIELKELSTALGQARTDLISLEAEKKQLTCDLQHIETELDGGWLSKICGCWTPTHAPCRCSSCRQTSGILSRDLKITDSSPCYGGMGSVRTQKLRIQQIERSPHHPCYSGLPGFPRTALKSFCDKSSRSPHRKSDSAREIATKARIYYVHDSKLDVPFLIFNATTDELLTPCYNSDTLQFDCRQFDHWKRN